MRQRLVYTRHSDGGVSVCTPSPEVVSWLGCGGFWGRQPKGFYDAQIERQIAAGHHASAVQRFVKAMVVGGCTTAEALGLIRDRDCAHLGSGVELWDAGDLPDDWFFDAWHRSPNGGPIEIDLHKARPIQWRRMRAAVKDANLHIEADLERFDRLLKPDWGVLNRAVREASSVAALRRVWPTELSSER